MRTVRSARCSGFLSPERKEYILTNDAEKVEQSHREEKQLTGIERCERRLNRSQRNHICASILVWVCLKNLTYQTQRTVYQIKKGLLSAYLRQQLRQPTIAFTQPNSEKVLSDIELTFSGRFQPTAVHPILRRYPGLSPCPTRC